MITHLDNDIQLGLLKICEPLFKVTGLNFFRFLRIYTDLSRIELCTNQTWSTVFYEKKFYQVAWVDKTQNVDFQNITLLWDAKAISEDNVVGVEGRQFFDIHHGASLVRKGIGYTEVYDFATTSENTAINNLYMEKIELLERFIIYFKDAGNDLIASLGKRRILLPDLKATSDTNTKPSSLQMSGSDYDMFLEMTRAKRLHVSTLSGECYLTKKEAECLYLSFIGKTAEEISIISGNKKRTIESHLSSVKEKLGVSKITETLNFVSIETLITFLK